MACPDLHSLQPDFVGGASSFLNDEGDDIDDEGDEDLKTDPVYTMDMPVSSCSLCPPDYKSFLTYLCITATPETDCAHLCCSKSASV